MQAKTGRDGAIHEKVGYVGEGYRSGDLTPCVPHEALFFNLNIGGDISVVISHWWGHVPRKYTRLIV